MEASKQDIKKHEMQLQESAVTMIALLVTLFLAIGFIETVRSLLV